MRISALSEAYSPELRKVGGQKRVGTTTSAASAPADESAISQKAKKLSDAAGASPALKIQVSAQPDVRLDKVAEVRDKISRGFYNTEEFTDKLADKLMKDFGLEKI